MNKTKKRLSATPEVIHFGIDYIRIIFSQEIPKFQSFFKGMSQNSHYREIDWYDFHFVLDYTFTGAYKSLKFHFNGDSVLYLRKYHTENSITKRMLYSIDIYSTAFCIPELRSFFSCFWRDLGLYGKITRLDLALDVVATPKEILDCSYKTQFPTGSMIGYQEKTGDCETRYFGNKHTKNKRHLIRIYDKLKDSQDKQKFKFFSSYFQFPKVSRIEVEIRSVTCKELEITPKNIGNLSFLESIFKKLVINEKGTHLTALENIDIAQAQEIELHRQETEIPLTSLEIYKRLLKMAITLHEAKATPIASLIEDFLELGIYQNPIHLKKLKDLVNNLKIPNNSKNE